MATPSSMVTPSIDRAARRVLPHLVRRATVYAPLLYHPCAVSSSSCTAQPTPASYNIWLNYDTSMPVTHHPTFPVCRDARDASVMAPLPHPTFHGILYSREEPVFPECAHYGFPFNRLLSSFLSRSLAVFPRNRSHPSLSTYKVRRSPSRSGN